jgi:MOSC domain-containing protein YiiM
MVEIEILTLVVSPVRRYDGRPSDGPRPYDGRETADEVQVRAHKGLVGDRYFGTRHQFAAVTFLASESIDRLEGELGTGPFDPALARRNVVTRGLDVESLLHTTFTIDAGSGPIPFRALTRANPCAFMNGAFADGAHQAMRGHAGIRTEPLADGVLRVGPATLLDVVPLAAEELTRRRRSAVSASGV